jgi:hypothetical protein
MSAVEVIELIKKLPPEEKAEVFAFVNGGSAANEGPQVRYLTQAEAERRAVEIFEKNRELFHRLAQ